MDSASKQKVLDWLADSSDEDDDPATPDAAPAAQFSITSPSDAAPSEAAPSAPPTPAVAPAAEPAPEPAPAPLLAPAPHPCIQLRPSSEPNLTLSQLHPKSQIRCKHSVLRLGIPG